MSIIKQDQRRLDNIARMYHKTGGEMKRDVEKKWYELIQKYRRKLDETRRDFQQVLENSLTIKKVQ